MDYKFRVGDAVITTVDHASNNGNLLAGCTGTVVVAGYSIISVAWDVFVGGHSCGGRCEGGYGWNVYDYEIEHYDCTELKPASKRETMKFLFDLK